MTEVIAPSPKKKGGMMKKLVLFGILPLLLVGGGAGAGLVVAGKSSHKGAVEDDPDRPKLMLKGSSETGTPATGPEPEHIDPARYQSTYLPLEQPFTSNLRDTDGFLQIGIGVSTYYDHRVLDNIKRAELPVRSAILEVLSQQEAEVINSPEGKEILKKQLRDAVNKVLVAHEGFGGIDSVFFTSFIIQ